MSNIVITGSTNGIGLNLALSYIKDGHNLVLISKNESKLNELKTKYDNVTIIPYDLTLNLDDLFQKLDELNIKFDLLINNAGFGNVSEFINTDIKKENKLIDLNVLALTKLTYYFLNKENCKIVNISSIASIYPGYNMSTYYASKAYVTSFTRALEKENKNRLKVINLPKINTNFDSVAGKRKRASLGKDVSYAVKKIKGAIRKKKVVYNIGFSTKMTSLLSKMTHRSMLINISKYTNEA
ncbi:MAG: SDR family NAD(P)-dependent oxidoreductase [Acholeplasmatales bacterium]|nr:SDR family NAD(P)-dependent oxidoreductase [Acholeplasmatales bacterium]